MTKNIAIIGASGAIGNAFLHKISSLYPEANISAFSRQISKIEPKDKLKTVNYYDINYQDENSLEQAAKIAANGSSLDLVIIAIGTLHDEDIMPEKALKELSAKKFHHLFEINTITPALLAKYFLPKLNRNNQAIFAALSARVGSISDNQMGGWYAYRASKAALNMIIKNAAIETARRNKEAIIIGLHPGTVNSALSRPFQSNVPAGKLFTPEFAATKLLEVLNDLRPADSGKCFAWDGKEVLA